ncbi:MAG TPA: hypothetical protein VKB95_01550 [Chitinophagaceae bacterium]|nr:hypothetical protein [Chitinophagaceae bacterium]
MYDITVIFTRHHRTGNCNSFELLNIIQNVEPDVIFEELSCSQFSESYEQNNLITVETNAVKEYLKNYRIEHIPVDTYPLPSTHHEEVDLMLDRVCHSDTSE